MDCKLITDWLSTLGEFSIAFVIYYEIEEQRVSSFLTDVQSKEFYKERKKIYEEYVRTGPADASVRERAELFEKKLWDDDKLRAICDLQWTYIYRLRFAVRRSIFHKSVVAKWFPQVLVSLWVMTNRYVRERERLRPLDEADYGIKAVRESLRVLKKRGLRDITIYASGREKVVIPKEVLEEMLQDLDAPFKPASA